MLKKIFVVLLILVCMTCLGCQQGGDNAANNIQRVSTKTELAHYIEQQRQAGQNVIPVVLTNGLTVTPEEFVNELCPSSLASMEVVNSYSDKQNLYMIFTLMDYPGTKVANAYLSKDRKAAWSKLNDDEKKLYGVAEAIVNEVQRKEGFFNQEAYIYDEIMNSATYFNGDLRNQPRFTTAIGALIDGKANCQGYSDAFYMLGRMLGWNVGRMGGQADGSGHQWNTITLGNGKTYCVDVTWGDDALIYSNRKTKLNSYIYLNAPMEIMQVTHSWDRSTEPVNLQPSVDENYAYLVFNNLARVNNVEYGLELLAQKIGKDNFKWFSVMAPYDERYANPQAAFSYLSKYYNGKTWLYDFSFGKKYLFITADTFD